MQIKYHAMALTLGTMLIVQSQGNMLLNLDIHDIKIRELINLISQRANKNIVTSDKVNGSTSLKLTNIPWRSALDTIVKMHGLTKHEREDTIIIGTKEEMTREEDQLLKSRVFDIRNVPVENLAKLLGSAGILSSKGKISTDMLSNTLVATDNEDHLNNLAKLVKQIDQPIQQILIEARIVSVDDLFMHELGLELHGKKNLGSGSKNSINLALAAPQGSLNLTMAKLKNTELLDLQLTALEKNGRGQVISKPKLLTADRQVAYIEAGAEIPYQEKTKKGGTGIAFKKAVLSLKVTPEILAKNEINLILEISQDKVGQMLINGVPTIETRKIQTQTLAKNNETIVLGGIYEWSKTSTTAGIPILKELPLIKLLCGKKITTWERKELLIFVTPQIIS